MKIQTLFVNIICVIALGACHLNKSDEQKTTKDSTFEKSRDTLVIKPSPRMVEGNFTKTLTWDELKFDIEYNNGTIVIQPMGLKENNNKLERKIEGTITDAQVEDLDSDGLPEILLYLSSTDENQYGTVVAYSVNHGKSMDTVSFTGINRNTRAGNGYIGHDKFYAGDGELIQSFPVYNDEKTTGSTRQLHYKLVKERGSKLFKLIKSNGG